MFRTVLLLFCMSAGIYNTLSSPSSIHEKKQGAKVYPVIPKFPIGCYYYKKTIEGFRTPVLESKNMSHLICATECVRRNVNGKYIYFGIANGDRCFCKSGFSSLTGISIPMSYCSYRCQQNDKQFCGGGIGILYFNLDTTLTPPETDEKTRGAKVYPVIPNSLIGCYHYYAEGDDFYAVIKSKKMSHLICATKCVSRDGYGKLKYFAIANGDRCFCKSKLPAINEISVLKYCSFRCQQNDKEPCGGSIGMLYFNLTTTLTPPETDEKRQGAKVYPVIPNSLIGCYHYHEEGDDFKIVVKSKNMSHLICATECVRHDVYGKYKYFAIANGDRCYCKSELPSNNEISVSKFCSNRCRHNDKELCGGSRGMLYFNLTTTLTPPETEI
ncbi:hypothetical protein BOX15_Mlig010030g1 [Macrostomum lignano]|uniref:WSC domain-containing protein n=1 Tax=Macrostomum lignano TaxID=282301 RepID=A0A267GE60_9PLAT|nr:hypothetical protein BOX15_Mlig010030g1 [Macrostomum lignano]